MGSRKIQGRHQRECSDCRLLLSSPSIAASHARATGHMASRYCDPCQRLFNKPSDLERHLRDSPKHRAASKVPPPRSEEQQAGYLHITGTYTMSSRPSNTTTSAVKDSLSNTREHESRCFDSRTRLTPPVVLAESPPSLEATYQRMTIAPSFGSPAFLESSPRQLGPDSPPEPLQGAESSKTGESNATQSKFHPDTRKALNVSLYLPAFDAGSQTRGFLVG
jgi:hypothetical protein